MVNFPSLLVSEEEQENPLEMPGGSTVHSWINADFVPSWLRPFTLDANTRFTRTPDHLLRPPEEAPPPAEGLPSADEPSPAGESVFAGEPLFAGTALPLPSFGTTGASWHFLEMPLDLEQEAPAVPSVRADREALEQALSDLPALRAARDGARTSGVADNEGDTGPEGWSMDESGVETVLPWSAPTHDMPEEMSASLDPQPELPGADLSSPSAWAAEPQDDDFTWPAEAVIADAPLGAPLAAPAGDAGDEAAPQDEMAQPQPFVAELAPVEPGFDGPEPWGATLAQETTAGGSFEAPSWPPEMAGDGPAAGLGLADALPVRADLGPAEVAGEAASAGPVFEAVDAGLPAMGSLEIPVADIPPEMPAGEMAFPPDAPFGGPEATDLAAMNGEGAGADFAVEPSAPPVLAEVSPEGWTQACEPLPVVAEVLEVVADALPVLGAGEVEVALLEPSAAPEHLFSAELAAPVAEREPGDGFVDPQPGSAPVEGMPALPAAAGFDDANVVLEDQGIVASENGFDEIEAAAVEADGFAGAFEVGEIATGAADDLTDLSAEVAGMAAEAGAMAGPEAGMALIGADPAASGALDAQDDAAPGETEPGENEAVCAVASAVEIDEPAPAHLLVLTRMIVVGRLPLLVMQGQDLLPPEPQPDAAGPAPEAPSASLVHAHFAWQPYHLSINGEASAPAKASAAEEHPEEGQQPALLEASAEVADDGRAEGSEAVDVGEIAFGYHLPPLDLLREPPHVEPDFELSAEFLDQSSAMLQQIVRDFGVRGEVIDANPGPVVTLYEFEPAPGVKSSRVIALAADIARSMSAVSARVAVVEGRNVIGIELPNRRRETVWLRELLASHEFEEARTKLGLCLGKTIGGVPVIADLARMPHLLVAGTTGSGKSVAINTMILSLLYRHTPDACRLIMIDPKMLELSVYEGIPHLLTPVVTDPKKAIIALKWAVKEMEDRYRKMARLAVRNIDGYNARMAEAREKNEIITRQVQVGFDKESGEALYEEQEMDLSALPYIVIIVDEMADLMMVAGKEIEGAIQRLAQMARAAGIHLVMATQRPSVDVITGTIKANFPTRISFQVTSKIDSRTILGEMGAETLLGQGDMLFMAGGGRITRVHGPFVSDQEVEHVVAFLKAQGGPEYLEDVVQDEEAEGPAGADDAVFDKSELGDSGGDLYEQAVAIVMRDRKASTSYIQRRLQVGYNKAASLMERMQNEGIVGPANHAGKREILSFSRPD